MSSKSTYVQRAVPGHAGLYRREFNSDRVSFFVRPTINGTRIAGRTVVQNPGQTSETYLQHAKDLLATLKSDGAKERHLGDLGIKKNERHLWEEAAGRYLLESQNKKSLESMSSRIFWLEQTSLLAGKYIDEIGRDDIIAIYQARRQDRNKPATSMHFINLIRAILNRAMKKWGWLDKVPTVDGEDFERLEKGGKRAFDNSRKDIVLSWSDQDKLLEAVAPHWVDIIQYSVGTGQRRRNVLGLLWSQIDMSNGTWVVRVDASEMKAAKNHEYPLLNTEWTGNMRALIERRYKADDRHQTHVFHYKGKPIKSLTSHVWKGWLKKAGIENLHLHDLRGSFCRRGVDAGVPIHLMALLGPWTIPILQKHYYSCRAEDMATQVQAVSKPSRPRLTVAK